MHPGQEGRPERRGAARVPGAQGAVGGVRAPGVEEQVAVRPDRHRVVVTSPGHPGRRVEQLVPLDQELAHCHDRVAVAAGDRRPVRLALPELGAGGQAARLDPGALLDHDGVAGDGHAARSAADPLLPDHVGLGDGFAAVHPLPDAGERVPHAGRGERDDHGEAKQQPTAHAPLRHTAHRSHDHGSSVRPRRRVAALSGLGGVTAPFPRPERRCAPTEACGRESARPTR